MKRIILFVISSMVLAACQPKDPVNDPDEIRARIKNYLKYNETTGFDYVYYITYRLLEAKNIAELGLGAKPEKSKSNSSGKCAEYAPTDGAELENTFSLITFGCQLDKIQPILLKEASAVGDEVFHVRLKEKGSHPYSVSYSANDYVTVLKNRIDGAKADDWSMLREFRSLELSYVKRDDHGDSYRFAYSVNGPLFQEMHTESQDAKENGELLLQIKGFLTASGTTVSSISVDIAELFYSGRRQSNNKTRKKEKQLESSELKAQVILSKYSTAAKVYPPLNLSANGYLEGTLKINHFSTTNSKDAIKGKAGDTVEFSETGITLPYLSDKFDKDGKPSQATRPWYHLKHASAQELPWMKGKSTEIGLVTSENRYMNWIPYTAIMLK